MQAKKRKIGMKIEKKKKKNDETKAGRRKWLKRKKLKDSRGKSNFSVAEAAVATDSNMPR